MCIRDSHRPAQGAVQGAWPVEPELLAEPDEGVEAFERGGVGIGVGFHGRR